MFNQFGLKKSCLVPVKGKMNAINGEGIDILGAVFLRLEGVDVNSGSTVKTAVMSQDPWMGSISASRQCGSSE